MSNRSDADTVVFAELPSGKAHDFLIEPSAQARAVLAENLGVSDIRKLRFQGRLTPVGKADWELAAQLGATVVQPCVVTLEPVTTRIDDAVARYFQADYQPPEEGSEMEMPEDDTVEALPATLDLAEVMAEALALRLPDYPRADGVEPADMIAAPPGQQPLDDEAVKPFAGLADLLDKRGTGDDKTTPDDEA